MKWLIGIYFACVAIFVIGASVLVYQGLREIQQVGLSAIVERIWNGPKK
jgi:hypothetical protein